MTQSLGNKNPRAYDLDARQNPVNMPSMQITPCGSATCVKATDSDRPRAVLPLFLQVRGTRLCFLPLSPKGARHLRRWPQWPKNSPGQAPRAKQQGEGERRTRGDKEKAGTAEGVRCKSWNGEQHRGQQRLACLLPTNKRHDSRRSYNAKVPSKFPSEPYPESEDHQAIRVRANRSAALSAIASTPTMVRTGFPRRGFMKVAQ